MFGREGSDKYIEETKRRNVCVGGVITSLAFLKLDIITLHTIAGRHRQIE